MTGCRCWLLLLLAAAGREALADIASHRITSLPGWSGELPSRMWAGHIDVAAEGEASRKLFYWFCEAEQVEPHDAPVVLWTNGGPGSDSLGGFFTELGPFEANEHDGGQTLRRNPMTWNAIANVLYLTHPTGVGYSYSANDINTHTDESDARDNHVFLRRFFEAYSEFATNDFWLTGESYAGIYIPLLAAEIATGNDATVPPSGWQGAWPHINLVGLFVGNGCTGNKTPSCGETPGNTPLLHTSSGQRLRVLHGHAMLSDKAFNEMVSNCPVSISILPDCMVLTPLKDCGSESSTDRLRMSSMVPGECAVWNSSHWAYLVNDTSQSPHYGCCSTLNKWKDLIGDVCIYDIMGGTPRPKATGGGGSSSSSGNEGDSYGDDEISAGLLFMGATAADWAGQALTHPGRLTLEQAMVARRKAAAGMSYGLRGCVGHGPWGADTPSPEPHSVWLNRADVREALHADPDAIAASHRWGTRVGWKYTRTVDSLLETVWPDLIQRYRTVIYSGDKDACVPFTGGQDWTNGGCCAVPGWLAASLCE